MANKYLKSSQVKVFPCAYRGQTTDLTTGEIKIIDPNARLNSEYNLTRSGANLKSSYIIDWVWDSSSETTSASEATLYCVIDGYYFEISGITLDDLVYTNTTNNAKSIYNLYIKTSKVDNSLTPVLTSMNNSNDLILDGADGEGKSWFYGLQLNTERPNGEGITELQVIVQDDNSFHLNATKYLPNIASGSGYDISNPKFTPTAIQSYSCNAKADRAFAFGDSTTAAGKGSHAEGHGTYTPISFSQCGGTRASKFIYIISQVKPDIVPGNLLVQTTNGIDNYFSIESCTLDEEVKDTYKISFMDIDQKFSSRSPTGLIKGIAQNIYSHSEGDDTTASGQAAHSEGYKTIASGDYSHAEGSDTTASGDYSHAEGSDTTASGDYSHAEGSDTTASGDYSHAEGESTLTVSKGSHAEGQTTKIYGRYSHTEGYNTLIGSSKSWAKGIPYKPGDIVYHANCSYQCTAAHTASLNFDDDSANWVEIGVYAHAEGNNTKAMGNYAHAEGYNTTVRGFGAHAEGKHTMAAWDGVHAEGINTVAEGRYSHVEGGYSEFTVYAAYTANSPILKLAMELPPSGKLEDAPLRMFYNKYAKLTTNLSEENIFEYIMYEDEYRKINKLEDNLLCIEVTLLKGFSKDIAAGEKICICTVSNGEYSHAAGISTTTPGAGAHTEGEFTTASSSAAHAEGSYTMAKKISTHAEGRFTRALGLGAHAEGIYTQAFGDASHAGGYYTKATEDVQTVVGRFNAIDDDALFIVGSGIAEDIRKNALVVEQEKNNSNLKVSVKIADKRPISDANRNLHDIFEIVYPVGSIYMSVKNKNPGELFGFGTWEQIQGRFLFACDSSPDAGSTGGSSSHTLQSYNWKRTK